MGQQTDLQYKDELRQELVILRRRIKLIEDNKVAELLDELRKDAERIEESLRD